MRDGRSLAWLGVAATMLFAVGPLAAGEITVAVASNFAAAGKAIEHAFETRTGNRVTLVFGSTGKHYAQIRNGAPVDVLLAADERRPRLLEQEGLAVAGSRFTYAEGRLALWSPRPGYVDSKAQVLAEGTFRHLAIANPELAPYGAAAREALEARGLWRRLERRIVRGENIAQALQFVESGNAELGFVASSQLTGERRATGSLWEVPQALYSPIEQQAVLLADVPEARAFLAFLRSDSGIEIIRDHGYEIP